MFLEPLFTSAGGYMIYSTCTFNPSENEDIVFWLGEEMGALVGKLTGDPFPGVTEVPGNDRFAGYGLYPGRVRGEGFFISLLRKRGEAGYVVPSDRGVRRRGLKSSLLDYASVISGFSQQQIVADGDQIRALHAPEQILAQINRHVRVVRGGTELFSVKGSDIVPSHQVVSSPLYRRGALPERELSYHEALRYLRRESSPEWLPPGNAKWFVLSYRGVPLGLAKRAGNRINNYYPPSFALRKQSTPEVVSVI